MSSYKIPQLNLLPVKPVKAKKLKKRKTLARYLNHALLHSRFGLIFGIVNLSLLIALGGMLWIHHRALKEHDGMIQDLTHQKELLGEELALVKKDLTQQSGALRQELSQLHASQAKRQTDVDAILKKMTANISRVDKRRFYLVKDGETLPEISQKIYGDPGKVKLLMELNRLKDPEAITAGDLLMVQK